MIPGRWVDDGQPVGTVVEPAVITAVTAGGTVDGAPRVTVDWRGLAIDVPYLTPPSPYTAAHVDATVAVLVQGPQLLLLGVVQGQPTTTV